MHYARKPVLVSVNIQACMAVHLDTSEHKIKDLPTSKYAKDVCHVCAPDGLKMHTPKRPDTSTPVAPMLAKTQACIQENTKQLKHQSACLHQNTRALLCACATPTRGKKLHSFFTWETTVRTSRRLRQLIITMKYFNQPLCNNT